jgi:histidinol dehydrogenase
MKLIKYPNLSDAETLLARPDDLGVAARRAQVTEILQTVKKDGDTALRSFSAQFDGFAPEKLEVTEAEQTLASELLPEALKAAIRQAYVNIRQFHAQQWEKEQRIETMPGVTCWRKSVAIGRVGLYIPGGTAPLFSTVLMLGVPAQLAGCSEIVASGGSLK